MKDQQLLTRLKNGDSRAVRQWFQDYHDDLLRFVLTKISDKADGEEIVQETFINCLKHLPFFRGRSSLATWMKSIARHEVADYYRKRYAKKALRTLPLSELVLGVEISNSSETSEKVVAVLKKMKRDYQELLLLKYVDRKKVKDIARELGRTVKAVESDLFRARRDFRVLYG